MQEAPEQVDAPVARSLEQIVAQQLTDLAEDVWIGGGVQTMAAVVDRHAGQLEAPCVAPDALAGSDVADLTGPTAIVLGSEAHGLSDEAAGSIDAWLSIPMAGRVESLNVAMAGTVLAYEVARQRRGPESV